MRIYGESVSLSKNAKTESRSNIGTFLVSYSHSHRLSQPRPLDLESDSLGFMSWYLGHWGTEITRNNGYPLPRAPDSLRETYMKTRDPDTDSGTQASFVLPASHPQLL